jgi:hypothetical protein
LHRESYGFIGLRIRVTGGLEHGDIRPAMDADLVRKDLDRARGHRPRVRESLVSLLIYLALPVLFIAFNPVDSYFERLREDEV